MFNSGNFNSAGFNSVKVILVPVVVNVNFTVDYVKAIFGDRVVNIEFGKRYIKVCLKPVKISFDLKVPYVNFISIQGAEVGNELNSAKVLVKTCN